MAYGLDRVPFCPSQSVCVVTETLDVCLVRAPSLEALHQAAQVCLRIGPNQQVEVRCRQSYFEHMGLLLASDVPEVPT